MMEKKITAFLMAILLLLGLLAGCGADTTLSTVDTEDEITAEAAPAETAAPESAAYEISSEPVKVYYKGSFGEEEEETQMYFLGGNKQIAYYDMDTVVYIMTKLYHSGTGDYEKDPGYGLTYTADGDRVTFTRENGYTMALDFTEDTVTFVDYDEFIKHSYDMSAVDLSHSSGYDADGQPVYLKRSESVSFSRLGKEMCFDLAKYDIDLVEQDGLYLIPAQTMDDILLSTTYMLYLYNGESAYYVSYDAIMEDIPNGSGICKTYFRADIGTRTPELIDFTYNELCMVLDYEYGLKESHKIESFDEYFEEVAVDGVTLKELFHSDNAADSEKALFFLTFTALGDLHSGYTAASAYAGYDSYFEIAQTVQPGASYNRFQDFRKQYTDARAEKLGEKVPGYQEVGNTAYVTFDSFSLRTRDYYLDPPQDDTGDTIGLLIYANSQIRRENSPIENVVLDLSCDPGGSEDAAAFVCAWFLGNAQIYLQNSVTGAESVNVYSCDANLDHKFDSSDNVSDLNLYCLISPVTFSCGNLAATMFDCSEQVTLLGQTSGGGSCVVLPLTTASGSILQVSGFRMISAMKNGSFYNCDQGVRPDVEITDIGHFYDREYLTDFINDLA